MLHQLPYPDPEALAPSFSVAAQSNSTCRTTYSTSEVAYWATVNGQVQVAGSQGGLRRALGAKLNRSRVALALCNNLPGVLRQIPFWLGIHACPPGHRLSVHGGVVKATPVWKPVAHTAATPICGGALVRDELVSLLSRLARVQGGVSCDVSGGLDSTALAFTLSRCVTGSIFYHASTDDPNNVDSYFARKAALELGGQFVELEPFSTTMGAFVADLPGSAVVDRDGPWVWGSNAYHLAALLQDASNRGVKLHITGLGGDELFSVLPTIARSLFSQGDRIRAVRAIVGMAHSQRWGLVKKLVAACSRESLGSELMDRVRSPKRSWDDATEGFSWAPGFSQSCFASEYSLDLVRDEVETVVSRGIEPWFADRRRHQIVESVMFQGEVIRQMNQAFEQTGINIVAPLLDDHILSLVLGLPARLWAGSVNSKPVWANAVSPFVPSWLINRRDKGEYSADLYDELVRRRHKLSAMFAESALVDEGFVSADAVRSALEQPVLRTSQLFELEHLASVERWMRGVI